MIIENDAVDESKKWAIAIAITLAIILNYAAKLRPVQHVENGYYRRIFGNNAHSMLCTRLKNIYCVEVGKQ